MQKVAKSTIRMRLKSGWSDLEIWAGKRLALIPISPAPTSTVIPPVVEDDKASKSFFLPNPNLKTGLGKDHGAAFPGERHDLSGRERNLLDKIGTRLAEGKLLFEMEDVLRHTIKNWSGFTEMAKSKEGAYGIPNMPTVDFFEKHLRVVVNLYLKHKNLEFEDFAVRSKEKPNCCVPGSVDVRRVSPKGQEQPTVPQRIFRDVSYDPPPFVFDPAAWRETSAEKKQADLERYVEGHLNPYNAQYTAETGEPVP